MKLPELSNTKMIRRGWASFCAIIGGFHLLVQHKLFPSSVCHLLCNALQNSLFAVKYYKLVLKITEKHTKEFLLLLVSSEFTVLCSLKYVYIFLILPTSPIQNVGKANIFAKHRQRADVLDTKIFSAADLTSCSMMILLCFSRLLQHFALALREQK